jgi:hypothetical protein
MSWDALGWVHRVVGQHYGIDWLNRLAEHINAAQAAFTLRHTSSGEHDDVLVPRGLVVLRPDAWGGFEVALARGVGGVSVQQGTAFVEGASGFFDIPTPGRATIHLGTAFAPLYVSAYPATDAAFPDPARHAEARTVGASSFTIQCSEVDEGQEVPVTAEVSCLIYGTPTGPAGGQFEGVAL